MSKVQIKFAVRYIPRLSGSLVNTEISELAFKYYALQNWNNFMKCYKLRQAGPFCTT